MKYKQNRTEHAKDTRTLCFHITTSDYVTTIIEQNIKEFLPILKQRRVEVAMKEVPEKIKEIKAMALSEVFANEVEQLDPAAREVLNKVINYMEKKYIKVPMVMAKEILVKSAESESN